MNPMISLSVRPSHPLSNSLTKLSQKSRSFSIHLIRYLAHRLFTSSVIQFLIRFEFTFDFNKNLLTESLSTHSSSYQ